ncbi:MAG: hypothetical protein R2716_11735 [Microthrixaceae bacterium]
MGSAGGMGSITVADVDAVRALMRSSDPHDRAHAIEALESYRHMAPTAEGMRVALGAACGAYPWVPGMPVDTGELFVQLTFAAPRLVDPADFERTYMLCAERGRRAVLRALALRADRQGLESVCHLMGTDAPRELLPAPSAGLLTPLLSVPGVEKLVPALVAAVPVRGWADRGRMIVAMASGMLGARRSAAVLGELEPVVLELADALRQRCAPPRWAPTRAPIRQPRIRPGGSSATDRARAAARRAGWAEVRCDPPSGTRMCRSAGQLRPLRLRCAPSVRSWRPSG